MAKKKFFNEKVNKTTFSLKYILIIVACIIGIFICFLLARSFNQKIPDNAIVEVRDIVTIKLFDDLPDKTLFFTELENVKESAIKASFKEVNTKKAGIYDVKLKIYNKKYTTKLEVIDVESPVLVAKNVTITEGNSYKANDFVQECKDNSKEKCNIKFYDEALNQDGKVIDYSNYKTVGEYTIQIIAYDNSDNYTTPTTATLTIKAKETKTNTTDNKKDNTIKNKKTTECKYGNSQYDTTKYVLATIVTENNCALDLNLYQDVNVTKSVNSLMEQETTKLKKEFSTLNINGNFTLNRNTEAILNKDGKGIVGYSLHMELLINDEIVESYYVKTDGTRVYTVNKYNLK